LSSSRLKSSGDAATEDEAVMSDSRLGGGGATTLPQTYLPWRQQ
jgi:hypothetical protein